MRVSTVVALVAALSAPVIAGTGVAWLGIEDVERVLGGENVTDVAQDIALREFRMGAHLVILSVETGDWTTASWGDRLHADEDHVYHHVRVRLTNDGKLEWPAHTRHFRAFDDANHTYRAEWGLAHSIDVPRLAPGASEEGVIVFHVRDYVPLLGVRWEGEFAAASALVPQEPVREPHAADGAAEAGGATEEPSPTPASPEHDEDEYQPHWDG